LDKQGIESLKENYKNKPIKVIYLDVSEVQCRSRMRKRGDGQDDINKRVKNDRIEFDGIEKLADVIISNQYFLSCVCDIWEYMQKTENDYRKKVGDKHK